MYVLQAALWSEAWVSCCLLIFWFLIWLASLPSPRGTFCSSALTARPDILRGPSPSCTRSTVKNMSTYTAVKKKCFQAKKVRQVLLVDVTRADLGHDMKAAKTWLSPPGSTGWWKGTSLSCHLQLLPSAFYYYLVMTRPTVVSFFGQLYVVYVCCRPKKNVCW